MKTSLRLYVYMLNLLGLGLVAYALYTLPQRSLLDQLIFIVLAAAVQMMPVALANQSTISVSWSIAYASVLLMGADSGVLTCMAIGLIASLYPKRFRTYRIIFNVAGNAIPAYVSGLLLHAVSGHPYYWVFEFLLVPLLYYLLNSYMFATAISLTIGESPQRVWSQNYRWLMLNYMLLAWIGIGLFEAYKVVHVLGLLIFFLPLIMARYSFKLYIDQTKKVQMHVDSLESTNRLLGRKVSELAALQKQSFLIGESLNLESTLQAVFERVTEDLPYHATDIIWLHPVTGRYEQIWMTKNKQIQVKQVDELSEDMKRAFRHGKRMVFPIPEGSQVKLYCPMISQGEINGVMTLYCSNDMLEEIDSSLDVYVSHAAVAISNAFLFQRVETVASTDNLTKLYNRHYFAKKAREWCLDGKKPITVIVMDFDNFKDINNRFGHHIGDLALSHVASLVLAESREQDIPVRYGGDEFALLLHGATEEVGLIVATRILERLREPVALDGQLLSVGLSIGIATNVPQEEGSIQEIVKQADKAAYASKANGKGCVTLYSQLTQQESQGNSQIRSVAEKSGSMRSITKGLLHAIKARDVFTYHHSLAVATYSVWLAQYLHMTVAEIEQIRLGALLHDIGKLGISDEVLYKTSVLSESELMSMRTHPVIGRELLQHFGAVSDTVLNVVYAHHERIDGLGYPERIEAGNLETTVRIVAIADAFDSMTRDSVYRDKLPMVWAIEELRRCAGTQFDPHLVEGFIEMLKMHFPELSLTDDGETSVLA